VQASSSDPNAPVANLINPSSLRDRDLDGLDEQSADAEQMWLSAPGDTKGWVEFDFGVPQKVSTICFWNYNDTWHTDRGVRTANISVWTPEGGWKAVRTDLPIEQAEGGDGYDEPTVVTLDAVPAQKVRLDNLTSLGDADCVGLSEVQFFTTRGPAAVRPYPGDGIASVELNNLVLTWIPGTGATSHNVYLGTDPQALPLLGKVADAEARLSRLADQAKYYWRVDTVQADGSIVKGATWSFTTSGLLAWWKFDESEGQDVADSSPYGNAGTLVGNAQWQPAGGRVGGAMEFDGKSGYVRIRNETPFDLTDEITVAAWVKVRAFNRTWQTIVAKGDHTWRLARDGDKDTLQFVAGSLNEGRIVLGNVNINDGQWHHVVAVGGTDAVSLYVDGVLDSTKGGPGKIPTDDEPVCIGENSMYTGRVWDGWIDEVCVFTYALSADEVKSLYSGKPPTALGGSSSATGPALVRPGSEATRPSPPDKGGAGAGDVELSWSPGAGAQAHNVYVGTDPHDLKLLGKVEQSQARLSGLKGGSLCYWRVDEVQADGSAVAGRVWSFVTGGLVGWWKLDEADGTRVADSSGNGHDGVIHGDPQWQPAGGKVGGALQFDGVDDYVDTGWAENLPRWTVAVWVTSPAAPASKGASGPVHRQTNLQLNWNHGNDGWRGAAGLCDGDTWYPASFGELKADTWYHLAATYDGKNLKAYRDGVLVTDTSGPSGHPFTEPVTLKFGRHAETADYFAGTIDDVRVFANALSAEEVKALYSGAAPNALTGQASSAGPCLVQATSATVVEPAATAPVPTTEPVSEPQPQVQPAGASQAGPPVGIAGPLAAAQPRVRVGLSLSAVLAIVVVAGAVVAMAVVVGISDLARKQQGP
jgi:hypothetical protein